MENKMLCRCQAIISEIRQVKSRPENKEFRHILDRLILDVTEQAKLESKKRRKRELVINALKNYFCELDELADETDLDRKDIKWVLKVLIRARLVVVKRREHYLNPDGSHGSQIFFWHESPTVIAKNGGNERNSERPVLLRS